MWQDLTVPPRTLTLAGRPLAVVGPARVYVCGVTPYDVTHLGHAATFVWMDTAVRVLRGFGTEVEVCRNVTDVDDVLTDAARGAGLLYDRFAALQQFQFEQDMAALNVAQAQLRATGARLRPQVVTLAAAWSRTGHAYVSEGSVYFRGAAAAEAARPQPGRGAGGSRRARRPPRRPGQGRPARHGRLAGRRRTGRSRARRGAPSWPSPWGPGRPGWHAECVAMALSVLGPSLDLHGGGADLRFPHHAYESAMAEAATGVSPFARRWMHVGTVSSRAQKMAKSVGNLVMVADLLDAAPRRRSASCCSTARGPSGWDYADDAIAAATERLDALFSAAGRPDRTETPSASEAVLDALADDLDVTRATDLAVEAGGSAARLLAATVGLSA